MGFLKKFTKQEISWMMYDWANSAHSVIVVTILPIFFDTVAGYTADSVSSMSTWGFATSLAMAIVALSAPFLGVFGDIRGMRKKLFTVFMLLGVVSVAGLAFTPLMDFTASTAAAGRVAAMVLVLYILSTIGFDASCIYYDAFLTDVTTEERMDSVSTLGYGFGYIGGSTIPLLIFLIMNAVGVPMLTCLAFIFALTAVWWLLFSLPLLKNCEQTTGKPYQKGDLGASVKNVFVTLKEIGADKPMLIYILSYFFYIDGVHTIISMSTSYGTNLGLDSAGMLLALLLVQVLGLPFCLLYMKLAAKFGARTMVGVGICVYMFICVFAFFMNSLWQFWMLAVLCATSQGGIQALSRSMFGKLIPDKARSGEFFGFFDIFGKFSSIIGPALVGAVSALAANRMMAAQGLTAATGMDALTHAIEGYITKGHCVISDMFHLEAIKLISQSLRGAVQNTPEGREGMALGQYIAGMGFSNVGLGIVHSMAHGLSALYDTPHGVACAILLPVGLEYNKSVAGERYRAVGKAMGVVGIDEMNDVEAADATIAAVKQLSADVGIPTNLHGILKEEDIQFLAESAFADACRPGNPRDTSVEEIVELYKSQL